MQRINFQTPKRREAGADLFKYTGVIGHGEAGADLFKYGRVYSTGLQGQVWQKTQVSQGKLFSAFCCRNNSPDRGIIKIHLRQHLYLMVTSK